MEKRSRNTLIIIISSSSTVKLQITKVERLENPNLWEEYCVFRNRLFRRMKEEHRGTAFTRLENVKGSSGPLRTTSNLSRGSVLQRDICPEVGASSAVCMKKKCCWGGEGEGGWGVEEVIKGWICLFSFLVY